MRIKTPVLRSINRLCTTTDFSNRRIADILTIAPNTVRYYREKFDEFNLKWKVVKDMDDDSFTSYFVRKKKLSKQKVMPDWSLIYERKSKNKYLTLEAIHKEYCAAYKENAYGYTQFTHYFRRYVKKLDISMRLHRYPGETMFVDFAGTLVPYKDPNRKGNILKAQIFVAVLGFSSYTFVYATRSQQSGDFIEAHVKAFEFFGGVTDSLIPDNLKSAVTKAGRDLVLQKTYQDMAEHYETQIFPARVRKPQDKAVAEQGVLFASRWIISELLERTFFSVEEINVAIAKLLFPLNERPMKNYKGSRKSRFESHEKETLKPLPNEPFRFLKCFAKQVVPSNYYVKVEGHFYSVPYGLAHDFVEAKISNNVVEIFHKNARVAVHQRSFDVGGFTADKNHFSPQHLAYANQSKQIFLDWAEGIGEATKKIIEMQYEGKSDTYSVANKTCSALKGLTAKYSVEEIEAACQKALSIAAPTITSIRSILRTGFYKVNQESISSQLPLPLHDNVRGADYYQTGDI